MPLLEAPTNLTPLATVGRQASLQMGCSDWETLRGPHSSDLHCVPKSHMNIGIPVAASCAIGTELGPPSEQNPCTPLVALVALVTGVTGGTFRVTATKVSAQLYRHPPIGGGGNGGGRGSGGGGFGSGGIGASVKESSVIDEIVPAPQSVASRKKPQTCVHASPSTCTNADGFSGVDSRPSWQIPSFAYAQASSPSTADCTLRTSSRGPHRAQLVPYAHSAGENDPIPPSRHSVSVTWIAVHVFWHPLNRSPIDAAKGGGGRGGGLLGEGGGGGSSNASPVTVNARSLDRWLVAHVRAQVSRPSLSPGHS
jgi:hypothetical protein